MVFTGDCQLCQQQIESLLVEQQVSSLWLGERISHPQASLSSKDYRHYLGQEYDWLICNAHQPLTANSLMALAGTVKAGGLMLLLTPPLRHWQAASTFTQWLVKHIETNQQVVVVDETGCTGSYASPTTLPRPAAPPCLSNEQQQAVSAILKVVTGHRKRPLLITADRGRGKSSALGLAAAQLIRQGKHILVSASRFAMLEQVFALAAKQLPDAQLDRQQLSAPTGSLRFLPVDLLLDEQPACDLLLLDEAATIPTRQLKQLTQHYNRVVFSSTIQGYEGSGRGFALRFLPQLKALFPQYRHIELHQPLRWYPGDPLEAFWQSAMLMQTPPAVSNIALAAQQPTCFTHCSPGELIQHPKLLLAAFQLLLSAHYQTSQDDLQRMLNDPRQHLFILQQGSNLLGVCWCCEEGGEPLTPQAEAICQGRRRLPGHLLPQALALQSGDQEWVAHNMLRVIRIAVLPELQGQGLGTKILEELEKWARTQPFVALGSSFGATRQLAEFWQRAGFHALQLGQKQDAASGEYALLVLKAFKSSKQQKLAALQQQLPQRLLCGAPLHWQHLDSQLLLQLLKVCMPPTPLTQLEQQQIRAYLTGKSPYQQASFTLRQLLLASLTLPHISPEQVQLAKLCLQATSKAELFTLFSVTTNKALQQQVRQISSQLFARLGKHSHHYT